MLKNRVRRQITLPPELDDKLVETAENEHRSVTNLIEHIVKLYIEKEQN